MKVHRVNTKRDGRRFGRNTGSAIIEFSFVIPALFIFFTGAFALGRFISQLAWMSQTGMEAVLLGSEYSDSAVRSAVMQTRVNSLVKWNKDMAAHTEKVSGPVGFASSFRTVVSGSVNTDVIEVELSGVITSPFGPGAESWLKLLPLNVSVAGPLLSVDTAGASTTFSNPGIVRDCNGNQCLGGSCGDCIDCDAFTGSCVCQVGTICDTPP